MGTTAKYPDSTDLYETAATLPTGAGATLEVDVSGHRSLVAILRSGATGGGVVVIDALINDGSALTWTPIPFLTGMSVFGATLNLGASTNYQIAVDVSGYSRVRFRNTAALGSPLADLSYTLLADLVPALAGVVVPNGTQVVEARTIVATYTDSLTPLGASLTYTGNTRDQGTQAAYQRFIARAITDQAGSFFVDISVDGTTWRAAAGNSVVANTPVTFDLPVTARYHRVRFVNGSTAQGFLMITSAYHRI